MAQAIPYIAMAVSAMGAAQQAQSQAVAARYNAMVGEKNAQITEAQGAAAAEAHNRDVQRRIGAAVAEYGAAGVDISTGSPADVLADSVRAATLDSLTLKYNYKLRALGFKNQSTLDAFSAGAYERAGQFSAAGALTKGASNIIPSLG